MDEAAKPLEKGTVETQWNKAIDSIDKKERFGKIMED
jgi:hypothetical protein